MQVKAAVTLGYQQPFVIKDVEVAPPGKDEILVKIVATGVCHTDAVMRDNPGVVPMPAILGHEGAGIVASVGEAVSGIRVGDHVVLSYAACHHCENCLSNHPSACEDFNTLNFGGRREDGTTPYRLGDQDLSLFFGQSSFSQYVVTRASNAVVVDPEVDLTLLGPLGCGIQTGSGTVLNRLKPVVGESLVVFGCGAVGLSAIMAAKLTGCSPLSQWISMPAASPDWRANWAPPIRSTANNRMPSPLNKQIKQITSKGARRYAVKRPACSP